MKVLIERVFDLLCTLMAKGKTYNVYNNLRNGLYTAAHVTEIPFLVLHLHFFERVDLLKRGEDIFGYILRFRRQRSL